MLTNAPKANREKSLPGKASLAVAAVLSCLFTVGSALALNASDLMTSALMFICASAVLSFFLIFVRHYLALLVPVLSVAVSLLLGCRFIFVSAVCCGVVVFAVTYTLCNLKLLDSFRQFIITALAYSVCGGGLFCLLLDYVYGSVGGGIVAFGNKIASMAPILAETAAARGIPYEDALSMFNELLAEVHVYIPAMIFFLGITSAWLMRGFFSLYTRVAGIPSLFGGRQTSAPKSLAAIFLLASLFGLFLSLLPKGVFFGISNVRSILSVIFMGEGARLYFASFSSRSGRRASPVSLLSGVILAFFFPIVIPVILPYYGAFRVLFARGPQKADDQAEK